LGSGSAAVSAESPATLAARTLTSSTLAPPDARQRISTAAFRLFSQKGYSCTSVHDIAEEAGVQKSILYYYYESKEALYHTLLSESASRLRGILDTALNATGLTCPMASVLSQTEATAPRRRSKAAGHALPAGASVCRLLGQFVETLLGAARDNREPVRFFMAHVFAPDADRPPERADDMQQIAPRITQHLIKLGQASGELRGDADLLEKLLLGAVQYSITRHLRSPEQEPLRPGTGQRIVRALVAGFAGRKSETPREPTRRSTSSKSKAKKPSTARALPRKTSQRRAAVEKKR
jgi:AcrR family transcriptional regulator